MAAADLEGFVREADRDRYLATLFAPEDRRGALFALYAFSAEIALVRERVSTPMLGEVRFQWWREVLEGKRRGEAESHPAASALLAAVQDSHLPREALLAILDARTFDLYDDPMPTVLDLEGYAGETSSALIRLACLVLGHGRDLGGAEAAGHGGVAYAVTGLLRALPHQAARGQIYVPAEILARHGVAREDILAGRNTQELATALSEMRTLARAHLRAARAAPLAKELAPAFLPVALVEDYLRVMERPGFDPFKEPVDVPQWRRQLRLWRAAAFGI